MEITQEVLKNIISFNPGTIAVYKISSGALVPLYNSPELPALSGMTQSEYDELTGRDASKIIIESDRPRVKKALQDCLAEHRDIDCSYRIIHKQNLFNWIHARARFIGDADSCPAILVLFLNISEEAEIHDRLLDYSNRKIYVIDPATREVLFANTKAIAGKISKEYTSFPCYKYIKGRDSPCPGCIIDIEPGKDLNGYEQYFPSSDRYYSVDRISLVWHGYNAYAFFIEDITIQKKAEKEILSRKEALEKILTNIPAGCAAFMKTESAISLITANRNFFNLMGLPEPATNLLVTGDIFKNVYPADQPVTDKALKELFSYLQHTSCDHRIFSGPEKKIRWLHAEGISSFITETSQVGYLCLTDITAQKEAELALANSRHLYEAAVHIAGMTVWEYDLQKHRITVANDSFQSENYQKFKLPRVIDNVPESLIPLIDEKYKKDFLQMYSDIHSGKPEASCEVWYGSESGRESCCEKITYVTSFSESGEPVTAYGMSQDITEERKAEEKYRRSMEELALANPHAIGSFKINLTTNWCGDAHGSEEAIALSAEHTADSLFRNVSTIIAGSGSRHTYLLLFNRNKLLSLFRKGQTHVSFDYERENRSDGCHWATQYLTMIQNPETDDVEALLYSLANDEKVKESQIIQHVTNEEYDFLGLLYPGTHQFIFHNVKPDSQVYTKEKKLIWENGIADVCTQLVDPEYQDAFRKNMTIENITAQLDTAETYTFSFGAYAGQQPLRKVMSFSWLNKSKQEILVIRTDTTHIYNQEQKQIQKLHSALLAAEQANEAKSSFMASMSHDMRTPLNGIIGFTDLALKTASQEKAQDYLGKIKISGELLLALINDTLELSKIESGKLVLNTESISLKELAESIVIPSKANADAKHISFTADISRLNPSPVMADRLKTQKICLNLISNAIKFTPENGTVVFTVETLVQPPDGYTTKISVSDSGIGISREFIPKMFDPFTQEHAPGTGNIQGTGLGLSIVKRLVTLMGGKIEVESSKGKGSVFTIYLPLRKSGTAAGSTKPAVSEPEENLAGRKVLICEDNYLNMEIIKTLVDEKGIQSVCAVNGKEAVAKFLAAPRNFYDAILMDLRMPVMDGYEATQSIRSLDREDAHTIPIIAMTADAYDEDIRKCTEAGMNAHIAKPIDPSLLFSVLASMLKENQKPSQ